MDDRIADTSLVDARPAERVGLGCIVCPLVPREVPAAIRNLASWAKDYPPVLAPKAWKGERPRLVYSFSCKPDAALAAPLREAFDSWPSLRATFSGLEIVFCDLTPEKDIYIRQPVGPAPQYGNKSGPNWLFYETLKAVRLHGGFAFLMEIDCAPVIRDWLTRLDRVAARHQDAWVLGAHYSGASQLPWSLARHINGNAMYNVGDPRFWDHLDGFFWEWMHGYIRTVDPNLAYDCAWEEFLNRPEMEDLSHEDWHRVRSILHKFRLVEQVVNIGGYAEQKGLYTWSRGDILDRFPASVVVHGPLTNGRDGRRGAASLGKPSMSDTVVMGDNTLNLEAAGQGDEGGAFFQQSFWLHRQMVRAGDLVAFRCDVRMPPRTSVHLQLMTRNGRPFAGKLFRNETGAARDQEAKVGKALTEAAIYLQLKISVKGPAGAILTVANPMLSLFRKGGEPLAKVKRMWAPLEAVGEPENEQKTTPAA